MKKDIIFLSIIVVAIVFVLKNVRISTVDEYYSHNPFAVTEDTKSVYVEIQCKDILINSHKISDQANMKKFLPSDGIILEVKQMVLQEGDTVFDVVSRYTAYENVSFEFSGNPHSKFNPAYINSIGGIEEFSCGATSGWQYSVNGKSADKSCDEYVLNDGDSIEFYFICDYTSEVKNK